MGRGALRDAGPRILQINALVGMDFREEGFTLVIQIVQQPGQMAVTGIEHDMAVMQALPPQAQQQRQRDFPFAPEGQAFRHARLTTARRVIKPVLGHEQFAIDQGTGTIPHQRSEDAHLAVLGLAQPAVPLTCHTDRLVALLGEGGFIKDQRRAVAEVGIGVDDQLLPDLGTRPVRFAQHVVKPLVVATRHLFGHLLHVAPVALEQAMEVTFSGIFNRAGPALKTGQVGAEVVIEMGECRLDQSANAFGILRPSWKSKASLN